MRIRKDVVPVLFDTGADVSVVRSDVWHSVFWPDERGPLQPVNEGTFGVSGEPLAVLGKSIIPVRLGPLELRHTVKVVEKLDSPLILGWDFMLAHGVQVIPNEKIAVVEGHKFPLIDVVATPDICRARLLNAIVVPPRTEVVVPAYLMHDGGSPTNSYDGVLEPCGLPGVVIGRVIAVATDALIPVRIMNPEDVPLQFVRGSYVGEFHRLGTNNGTNNVCRSYELMEGYEPETVMPDLGHFQDDNIPAVDLSKSKFTGKGQKGKLKRLLREYGDVFSKSPNDRGLTHIVEHCIDTGDSKPIKQPPRRVPFHLRDELDTQVKDMLDDGVIEPCSGPWSSPVVLVKKKDGGFRFCVDYRKLNAVTCKDAHSLPRIDDSLATMAGAAVFSNLDLTSSYWQVPVHVDSRNHTAFSVGPNLYRFSKLPFGLCNAPPLFQRLIELVFAGMSWREMLAYLDDFAIFTKDFDSHMEVLKEVFDRLRRAGLKLQPKKCHFVRDEIVFLGHHISKKGVKPDPQNIAKVKDWPVPRTVKQVRSFLGLASYYRRFVKGFSEIARLLTRLTEKAIPFIWDSSCQDAFELLKSRLVSPPILGFPRWGESFTMYTHASDFAIGSVLAQQQDGDERVIAYLLQPISRKN